MRSLAELDEAVDELQQGQLDQLQPGVFSINAAGQLEEILSGKLTANGIIFNLGTSLEANQFGPGENLQHELIWSREETGVGVASVSAARHSAKPPGLVKGESLLLKVLSDITGQQAALIIDAQDSPAVLEQLLAVAGAEVVKLINSNGESTFARLTALLSALESIAALEARMKTAEERFTRGAADLTWPGGGGESNTTTVEHGLGTTPKVVIASYGNSPAAGQFVTVYAFARAATTFQCRGVSSTVVAGTVKEAVQWIAIK